MLRQSITIATTLFLVGCAGEPPSAVGPRQERDGLPPVARTTEATLSVSIHALYTPQNATVKPNQMCTYRADATGGVSPVSYNWTSTGLDSLTGSTSRFANAFVGSGAFTIKIKVTDAVGDTAVANKAVSVASSGIVCP